MKGILDLDNPKYCNNSPGKETAEQVSYQLHIKDANPWSAEGVSVEKSVSKKSMKKKQPNLQFNS